MLCVCVCKGCDVMDVTNLGHGPVTYLDALQLKVCRPKNEFESGHFTYSIVLICNNVKHNAHNTIHFIVNLFMSEGQASKISNIANQNENGLATKTFLIYFVACIANLKLYRSYICA